MCAIFTSCCMQKYFAITIKNPFGFKGVSLFQNFEFDRHPLFLPSLVWFSVLQPYACWDNSPLYAKKVPLFLTLFSNWSCLIPVFILVVPHWTISVFYVWGLPAYEKLSREVWESPHNERCHGCHTTRRGHVMSLLYVQLVEFLDCHHCQN